MDQAKLRIEPSSARFDPQDDRWLTQVGQFVGDLNREVGGVSRSIEPVPGTMGGLGDVVISLTSAGVLTSAVEFFRAWVGRDASRSIKVSLAADGRVQAFEFDGKLSQERFDEIVGTLARSLPGAV